MGLQELLSFWSKFQSIIEVVSQEFDAKWQDRKRALNTKFLILFIFKLILSKNKQGYSSVLSEIWDSVDKTLIELPQDKPFAASSVCEARQKMPEEVFTRLNTEIINWLHDATQPVTWNNHRVFAIDGSKLNLPPELANHGYKNINKSHYTTGLLSCLYNLAERTIYNCVLESHLDERNCAIKHMDVLSADDILVLDRGYFSYLLLYLSVEKGINLICRMQSGNVNPEVQKFCDSNSTDTIIDYTPSNHVQYDLKRKGYTNIDFKSIKLRLIKYKIGNEIYIIATTLISDNYLERDFAKLYYGRWSIEELYKISKRIIEIEDFHSKTDRGVKQEIYAHILLINIARIFESSSLNNMQLHKTETNDSETSEEYNQWIYTGIQYIKINFKNCILVISRYIEKLIYAKNNFIITCITRMANCISKIKYKIRPGRKSPRVSRKPISKWGFSLKKGVKYA